LVRFATDSALRHAIRRQLPAAWDLRSAVVGGTHVINRIFSGSRCRVIRQVHYPDGAVHRFTLGTIRYAMENLGRELVMVDWDTGRATVVFPHDIELVAGEASATA